MTFCEVTGDFFNTLKDAAESHPDEIKELISFLEDEYVGGSIYEIGPSAAEVTEGFVFLLEQAAKDEKSQNMTRADVLASIRKLNRQTELNVKKFKRLEEELYGK